MPTEDEWAQKAQRLLKAELKRRDVSYQQLSEKLAAMGATETPAAIANKISRGKFTAAFLLMALNAIGSTTISLAD